MTATSSRKRSNGSPFLLILLLKLIVLSSSSDEKEFCSLAEDGTYACEEIDEEEDEDDEIPDFEIEQLVFPCTDKDDECEIWADEGECANNPEYMFSNCIESCDACYNIVDWDMGGPPQRLLPGYEEESWEQIIKAKQYLSTRVAEDPVLSLALPACVNDDPRCAFWAVTGECEENPTYMRRKCAPMCQTCEETSLYTRCPVDHTEKNAWEKPGDLNHYFENMTTLEAFQKYEPKVWSRPGFVNGDTEETADYILGPWVVTLENFLSQEEADRLIQLGREAGFEQSTEYGEQREDGTFEGKVSDYRTSKNAWCQDECAEDPVAIAVMERMADVANMSSNNSEYLQLLEYQEGQYYKPHIDHEEADKNLQPGVRILTVFLYLNSVEEGGGTRFPELDITIEPKVGRVLIWPSVLDEAPHDEDPRSEHEALPVVKGRKYAANGWFRQRNFKGPYHSGCTS